MLIILEGVDGSGKTSLCKKIESLGAVKVGVGRDCNENYKCWNNIKNHFKNILAVSDRSFITDLVYRLQDDLKPSDMTLKQMCDILEKDVKIVLCESETCFEDSMMRGEDNIISKDTSNQIKNLYETVTTMFEKFLNVPVLRYNWKTQNIDDVINFIKEENNAV